MSEAYDLGVQTALAELEEQFGSEVMEKVAWREKLPRWLGGKPASRIQRAKNYIGGKYKSLKAHVGKHSGKYGLGAGAVGGVAAKSVYDR